MSQNRYFYLEKPKIDSKSVGIYKLGINDIISLLLHPWRGWICIQFNHSFIGDCPSLDHTRLSTTPSLIY